VQQPFTDLLERAEDRLWLAFQESAAVQHSGLKGAGRESAVIDFLEQRLASRCGVARGEAFDSAGERSAQLDVAVYDRLNFVALAIDATNSLLPEVICSL